MVWEGGGGGEVAHGRGWSLTPLIRRFPWDGAWEIENHHKTTPSHHTHTRHTLLVLVTYTGPTLARHALVSHCGLNYLTLSAGDEGRRRDETHHGGRRCARGCCQLLDGRDQRHGEGDGAVRRDGLALGSW